MTDDIKRTAPLDHGRTVFPNYRYNVTFEPSLASNRRLPNGVSWTTGADQKAPDGVSWSRIWFPMPHVPTAAASISSVKRTFIVRGRLCGVEGPLNDTTLLFSNECGSSQIAAPGEANGISVEIDGLIYNIYSDKEGVFSTAEVSLEAFGAVEARGKALMGLNAILSHISFVHSTPVSFSVVEVRDTLIGSRYFYYQTPHVRKPFKIDSFAYARLLAPIFSLYREAKNSVSVSYRLFCYAKIMEGMFKSIPKTLRAVATNAGFNYAGVKVLVPDSPFVHSSLRHYIGRSVGAFYNEIICKNRYRDLLAHFELDGFGLLNVDDQSSLDNIANVSFLADICCRELIDSYIELLKSVSQHYDAES